MVTQFQIRRKEILKGNRIFISHKKIHLFSHNHPTKSSPWEIIYCMNVLYKIHYKIKALHMQSQKYFES